ncbi:MAG: F0F1 ATP synthase subunit A [Succiniclasticum sp.]|jgi:F-type H+-transporting ATPase subunit a
MGNEAAAAAAEAAGHSEELIHYLAREVAPGITINMQTMYMTWISMILLILLFIFASKNAKLIPSGVQNVMEFFVEFIEGLVSGSLGEKGRKAMLSFFVSLFMFILISNELGMLPQVGVHWTSPTNDINTCFALSLTVAIGVYFVGVATNGFGFFKHFISPSPAFLPLHLLDELTKPLTMALRLFGNILAGEILLIILYKLAPWIVPEFWVMFSLFIGFLQAFIFTMLSLGSYEKIYVHH